jgi:hypothetical protein
LQNFLNISSCERDWDMIDLIKQIQQETLNDINEKLKDGETKINVVEA